MKTIKVVAAVIHKDNKILIAQRLKGEFEGRWEFPGGKIEANESPREALIREIREELEVSIDIENYLMTATYQYKDFRLEMECYMCSIKEPITILNDHKAIKWIPSNININKINWVKADVQVIRKALIEIKKN
ncbi:MAG: (deoxy)nucleoside triphosphate pyrophosphohydrolase [Erysipelotrichaceae bacterium]